MLQEMIDKYSSNTVMIGSSVTYAESLLQAGETVLYAWFGTIFTCNCSNRFNNDVVPLSQKKAAVIVATNYRLIACYKSLVSRFAFSVNLSEIVSMRFNKPLIHSSQIIARSGFNDYYIDVNAKYVEEIFSALCAASDRVKAATAVNTPAQPSEKPKAKPKKKKEVVTSLEYKAIVYSKNPKPKEIYTEFHTKVAGVTFKNDDGSDRQKIVKKCKEGQAVYFRPVPTEEHPKAIGVFTSGGKQLGHVSSSIADDLIFLYPNNPAKVTIANITGGNGKNYGCNLFVQIIRLAKK
ncbi:hypothetical protein [Ruminococcus sp.]|uniref:hypothetical protein n=1 Tax=Ruminococcus sp. TaxID=41978 RepID=UPI0025E91761|nr:hypothetical protein [Ruminococcus sp.]MBQ8965886.1 HIRAN domain-containing protein [Ruminococcus sp.]